MPVATIKKKKVKWWKRIMIFALGVVQICMGAIILATTAGALTGLGIQAMTQGAKFCFDAIFRP